MPKSVTPDRQVQGQTGHEGRPALPLHFATPAPPPEEEQHDPAQGHSDQPTAPRPCHGDTSIIAGPAPS